MRKIVRSKPVILGSQQLPSLDNVDFTKFIPTESDISNICNRYIKYTKDTNKEWITIPANLAASTKDFYKQIKYFIIALLLDYTELAEEYKKILVKIVSKEDIIKISNYLKQHLDDYFSIIQKYQKVYSDAIKDTATINEAYSRNELISLIQDAGYTYNFNTKTNRQLYYIYKKIVDKNTAAIPASNLYQKNTITEKTDKHSNLKESIIKHNTLNSKLWNIEDNTLKIEVKNKIKAIVKEFINRLKEDEIKIKVKDIILVGSNCSYNYTKNSDLDIHILVDNTKLNCPDALYPKLYSAYRTIFNKNLDIDFYGIPIEIYVQIEETPLISGGIYSVKKDAWIKEPVKEAIPNIDMEKFQEKFKLWEDKYNKIIDKSNKILKEKLDNDNLATTKASLANLLKDEWEAVEGYQDAISNLNLKNRVEFEDIINILNDISDEELTHSGELQTCLNIIDNTSEKSIADGKVEASEKIINKNLV